MLKNVVVFDEAGLAVTTEWIRLLFGSLWRCKPKARIAFEHQIEVTKTKHLRLRGRSISSLLFLIWRACLSLVNLTTFTYMR